MGYYVGLGVSLEMTSVCIVDAAGKVVSETKFASEPAALIQHLTDLGLWFERIGLEAGPLSEWLAPPYVGGRDGVPLGSDCGGSLRGALGT